MTLEEYIKNPMGSSVMTNRQVYYNMYSEKWNTIRLRENGLITYTLYQEKESYYIHFKIPSEVVPKFYYDTIVRFYLTKDKADLAKSKLLTNYEVQFYSNDPSFVYTFAHAFNKNGLFIKDLEDRMIERCLKEKAVEKNPKDEVGYVKSLYFAYLEIKDKGLLNKVRWEGITKPYSKKVWPITVRHAYDVVEERKRLGEEIAAKERLKKKKEEQQKKKDTSTDTGTKSLNKSFKSPNTPNFGQFKRNDYNKQAKNKFNIKKGIGQFVNQFKTKK